MKKTTLRTLVCALPILGASAAAAQHNTLTPAEEARGYELLFNGTNLNGWRSWNSMSVSNAWKVLPDSTGATYNSIQIGTGTVSDMITVDSTFQNFDFKFEAYVPSAGNSGVFIRYNQYGKNNWGGASGPELQLAATNNSDGTHNLHRMGTCYDMFPLLSTATNWDKIGPGGNNYGVYQQIRIVAYNNRVAHFGNGIKLVEYDMNSAAYNTAYNASKYKTYPVYRTVHQGGIYLQHHGETGIKFRNLRIKRLTASPWAEGSAHLTTPSDTNSGLKAMSFADNFGDSVTSIKGSLPAANRLGARVVRESGAVSLVLARHGDYQVRVSDLNGKTVYAGFVRNADRLELPAAAFAGDTRVLRVSALDGSGDAHNQLVAPLR